MNDKVNSQYRFATVVAVLGTFTNGIMRFFENGSYNSWEVHPYMSAYISIAVSLIMIIEYLILRNNKYTPFVIVSTVTFALTIGSYFTTEWDHYYLASLSMIGIMCLYGQIHSMILHQITNGIMNVFVFLVLLEGAPDGFREHMLNSFFLYLYASIFLIVQFHRANKKEGEAHSGLKAFSSLLGSTPNLMVIVDDKRKVRYISSPLAEFAGMDEKVAIGRPLVDLFKTESLKLMFADILDAESFYSETREIDVNNEPRYFKIIADKLSDSGAGMFIEITDMTEIVLASIKADEARNEAEIANNSKSAFLTTMSHEIRTPMNAIIGISEIQLSHEDLPEDVARALRQIHASGHGLLGIINDILDLSKIETGKFEINSDEYDVPSLINDAVQLNLVRVGSKPIVFSLEVEENLPARLIGDEIRLKQILNNILSNAFKYTDEGSVKLYVSHHIIKNGIELVFKVTDTGQGMKPQDLSRLFDEYSRFNQSSNRTTEGTGLGMNITQRLVHMMSGKIDVESQYGIGSTFTITVLQQPSQNKSIIGREHAQKLRDFTFTIDTELNNTNIKRDYMPYGKVLVVDDVHTNLYVAKGLLIPYGLTVETASSGFEAIDMLCLGEEYDIVFMDHMMPVMDGVETTRKLRDIGYKGVIIALTANAIAGNDKFFKENGFEDFISKPIDMRHMNVILNQYIRDKQNPKSIDGEAQMLEEPQITPASVEVDRELLEIFIKDAKKAITNLSKASLNGDYKLFTTTAHAMKSATINIGQAEISALANSLEQAGNEADKAFIDKHTPKLIYALAKIISEGDAP